MALVIISGEVRRWVPAWYARRVAERMVRRAYAEPGFHRVVLHVHPAPVMILSCLVNPDVEPDLRRIMKRALRLDAPEPDLDPYMLL